jgi:hypothetical protein
MPAESTLPRRVRRLLSFAAAGAACAVLGLAGAVVPSDRPVAVAAEAPVGTVDGVRLSVAPAEGTDVAGGEPIGVVVEIVNGTDAAVRAGTLQVGVAADGLDDHAAADAWLAPEDGDGGAGDTERVAERATASLAAGAATTLGFTIPAAATDPADPVIGLSVELEVDGIPVSTARTIVANSRVPVASAAGLALAYPLTVPPQETGLIPADRLESWTAPAGLLTRQLDAVAGAPVAVGIDPRIPASIRILGTSAPASAAAWLQELELMPNEAFPLAYADADLAAQAQVGLDEPLGPLGFDDALDPADFPADTGDTGATATPGTTPDEAALLDWDFTRADIAWPADDTVATGDLDRFAAGGLTTAILAPGNVESVDSAVNAGATIDGRAAVVADDRVTDALRAAAAATSETTWRSATARLLAELALAGHDDPVTLLGTFDRSAGLEADRVAATVSAVASGQWARPTTLAEAVGAPPAARTLVSLPEDGQRLENVDRLLQAERSVGEFADVLADPTLLTGPTRRDLLALLDVGWLGQPAEWTESVGRWLVDRRAVTDSVSIVPSSSVLVVATETGIPITVQNDLPYPVDVVVQVDPSNGRLIVEDSVEATVEAESRSTVRVPVAAGVGSGEVTLEAFLSSPDGTPVGTSVDVPANVQADWEGVGAAVLAAIAVAVFAIGLLRAFRRRRRDRAAQADGATPAGDARVDATDTSAEPAGTTQPTEKAEPSVHAVTPDAPDTEDRPHD